MPFCIFLGHPLEPLPILPAAVSRVMAYAWLPAASRIEQFSE